ncbi:unnamed protein product, partial [Mesorhabditis spiculigera]
MAIITDQNYDNMMFVQTTAIFKNTDTFFRAENNSLEMYEHSPYACLTLDQRFAGRMHLKKRYRIST